MSQNLRFQTTFAFEALLWKVSFITFVVFPSAICTTHSLSTSHNATSAAVAAAATTPHITAGGVSFRSDSKSESESECEWITSWLLSLSLIGLWSECGWGSSNEPNGNPIWFSSAFNSLCHPLGVAMANGGTTQFMGFSVFFRFLIVKCFVVDVVICWCLK